MALQVTIIPQGSLALLVQHGEEELILKNSRCGYECIHIQLIF